MSKYDNPTQTARCPACAVECLHRVVFENSEIRHLRCDACDACHVCAMKGSFQSSIANLPFAEIVGAAGEGEPEAYSIRSAFHPTGVFAHPKFGTGYVFAILSPPQKMEALFEDKVRFLVCGPGSGVAPGVEDGSEPSADGDGEGQEITESASDGQAPEADAEVDEAAKLPSEGDEPIF